MSEPSSQLSLSPQERRVVMVIGLTLILVLNYLFVWPHFGEWRSTRKQLQDMYQKIETDNREIKRDVDPTNGYQKVLAKLVRAEGAGVMDKQVQLQSTVMSQARRCGVNVDKVQPAGSRAGTNEFFDEETIQIQVQSQEAQLINFLYSIGNDPAMIRVTEWSLKPLEPTRYHLGGTITLAANYKKAAPPPPAAPAAKPNPAVASKPNPAAAKPPQTGAPPKPPMPALSGAAASKPAPRTNSNTRLLPGRSQP